MNVSCGIEDPISPNSDGNKTKEEEVKCLLLESLIERA